MEMTIVENISTGKKHLYAGGKDNIKIKCGKLMKAEKVLMRQWKDESDEIPTCKTCLNIFLGQYAFRA
jgi:hypothetical protein